jgi:hypothetical protein
MMYDYRLLFPRVGSSEILRELTARADAAERRRRDGCLRPEQRTPGRRTQAERS